MWHKQRPWGGEGGEKTQPSFLALRAEGQRSRSPGATEEPGPAPPRPHRRPALPLPPGPLTHLPSLRCSPARCPHARCRSRPSPAALTEAALTPDLRPTALTEAALTRPRSPWPRPHRGRRRCGAGTQLPPSAFARCPGLNVSDAPRAPFPLAGRREKASADWSQQGNTGRTPAHWPVSGPCAAVAGPSALRGRAEGRVRRRVGEAAARL